MTDRYHPTEFSSRDSILFVAGMKGQPDSYTEVYRSRRGQLESLPVTRRNKSDERNKDAISFWQPSRGGTEPEAVGRDGAVRIGYTEKVVFAYYNSVSE
jgi:hypothetical protein